MDFHSEDIIATLNAENECMEMNNEEGDEETQAKTVFDSNQGLRADVWKEFVSVGVWGDGKKRSRCIHCSRTYVTERLHGTSHLRRHLLSCTKKAKKKSGGNDEQERHKHSSTNLKGASVSKSSCNRALVSKYYCNRGVNNILSKKRQHCSISEGKKRSAMLLGLDILDCPICFEALTIPIFQCDNGHLACSSCCPKLSNKCPTCASPVGHNRCKAMESVLESVFVPCQNAKFGCTKNVSYGKESIHKKECTFSLCSCPALDCNYTGSYNDIYTHFVDEHSHESKSMSFVCGGLVDVQMNIATNKILVLWESKKRVLFALQCFNEPCGVYVTVRCIAPSAPELGKLAYCLYYSMDGHTLTYKSPEVKMVLKLSSKIPQDNFMFVPHSLLRGESLEMKISIGLKCDNGHIVCSTCCNKVKNKCPTCAIPIGHIRCRAMERVLEAVIFRCPNAKLGCTKNVSYGKESTHEKECPFYLCSCPARDCNYTGFYKNLYSHFDIHRGESRYNYRFLFGQSFEIYFEGNASLVMNEYKDGLLFVAQFFAIRHMVIV